MSGSKLKLVTVNDGPEALALLHTDLRGIVTKPEDVRDLYPHLKHMCETHSGVGIAANQLGLRENFFFIAGKVKLLPCPGGHICINPQWEPHKNAVECEAQGEGCLSLPPPSKQGTRRFNVKRWNKIRAWWTNTSGQEVKPRTLSGFAAQVFQHEHDHLRGRILTDHGTEVEVL